VSADSEKDRLGATLRAPSAHERIFISSIETMP